MEYNFKKIEAKWQKKWEKEKIYEVKENPKKDKFYCLIEFPYPSGEGLHVGHPRSYTALDIVARKKRMQGKNVLYPIGWDAYGLPTENYAIKTGIQPAVATEKNIKNFTRQLKSLGFSFDWSREINTADPEYYKWTQWMFLQFFKHGLAYKDKIAINWCTKCKIGLANEEVVNGVCERCGGTVEKRMKEQWMIKITKYAERLLEGLKKVDYSPRIKEGQINWIGKSEGAEVDFQVVIASEAKQSHNSGIAASPSAPRNDIIKVFTTRPDTLFGATYMVLAPEHELVEKLKSKITNWNEVEKYINEAKGRSDLERQESREKTGVELKGIKAANPANNEEISIWVADYVLTGYGTGAIMAVPAHDERDFEFAKKFGLPIRQVIAPYISLLGNSESRCGKETRKKIVVTAIIRNPKENKFLLLRWKNGNCAFAGGAVEEGEATEDAIVREAKEETGYNIKIQKVLIPAMYGHGYKPHKDINCFDFDTVFLADIVNDTRGEIGEGESHEFFWCDYEDVEKQPLLAHHRFMWRWFVENKECFSGDGIAISSGFLNSLPTPEAKEKIIKWLEEKHIGKKAVNYKLRDWVFSRQRYWGEPIPLVHCENCAKKKQKVLLIHGFEGSGEGNWLPWLKKELEARGFEVFNPTMSTSEHPTVESWLKELLPYAEKMGEDDIIVGHSLGGRATLYLIEKIKKKIGHLFLIGASIGNSEDYDWDWFKKEWEGSDIDTLEKFHHTPINWDVVDKFVQDKNIVLSDDDPYIKKETHRNLPVGWFYQIWSGFGHFQEKQAPELLNLILSVKNTGWQPVEEKDLPIELPKVKKYEPTETGESPLAAMEKWVKTKCPKCGGEARRETDTMPNWAGSSWYFTRYTDPKNKKEFASGKNLKYWMPVDWYNGGMEHTTLHLLYSRFWYKFLYDIGAIPKECGDEPYKKRTSHGLILGEGGEKMSKSRGNVVNPDDIVARFGADTLRVYEMFMGPFEQAIPWDEKGVVGVFRFLERVWGLKEKIVKSSKDLDDWQNEGAIRYSSDIEDMERRQNIRKIQEIKEVEKRLHQTIKKVSKDIEEMKFNTAIAQMMIFVNGGFPPSDELKAKYPKLELGDNEIKQILKPHFETFLRLLAPFAPHLAEELWEKLGNKKSIHLAEWPKYDAALIIEEEIDLIVQINGKMRDSIKVKADISEEEAKKVAAESEKVKKWIDGQKIKKIIFVKGRLVNIVV
jgi:leucyl-tRNA synthetase